MQLETIGLDLLNMDGTKVRTELGNSIPTCELTKKETHYQSPPLLLTFLSVCPLFFEDDSYDVLTMARVWTGFVGAK